MKKISALIPPLFFAGNIALAQTNDYFANDPVWTVLSKCKVSDNCIRSEYTNYYTNGDTLLQGLTYKKVYKKAQWSLGYGYTGSMNSPVNCVGSSHYILSTPSYFMRSAGKQMFLRFPKDTGEKLLYNFDLSVGDTLPLTHINNQPDIVVTAIDSIYTPFGYRTRYALNTFQYLYEGIGNTKGFVESMGLVFDCFYSLDCFSLNNTSYFPTTGPSCNIAVGISSLEKQATVSVFPNPFGAFTTMRFNTRSDGAQLKVFDHLGQEVRTLNGISGESVRVERGSLTAGLYYYELENVGKNIATGKLIVTD